ncbi:MAG: ethylbenzene dehydrogenase-related protein [Halioglobus sp.]
MIKAIFTAVAIAGILAACSEQVSEAANQAARIVIDDTPILALEVGGIVNLSRQPGADFSTPDSAAWRAAQEYSLDLNLAPPVHQSINLRYDPKTPPVSLNLRAGHDGEALHLRMRWSDSTHDVITSRQEFSDGAAVQFALEGGPATSYMMGAPTTPVNIWYWKAGLDQPQNLAAGGFGSTTRLEQGQLAISSTYRDSGEWVVVFSRPVSESGEHQADFSGDTITLALALWQGDAKQRDGLKHVSPGWVTLQ